MREQDPPVWMARRALTQLFLRLLDDFDLEATHVAEFGAFFSAAARVSRLNMIRHAPSRA